MSHTAPTLDARPCPADDEGRSLRLVGLPGRFVLHYQPEIDLRTGRIGHCESLLRWVHPAFGLLRPGPSLGGTRWTDRVGEIEDWSLRAVCEQGSDWFADHREAEIALNVTGGNVVRREFLTNVGRALASTGLDPRALSIDVPVSALALTPVLTEYAIAGIADLGVRVTLDGVRGDTSFDLLDRAHVDTWKIELGHRAHRRAGLHRTVAAAVTRARDAGVFAVAKAVEDEVTLREVRDLGFDRAFGHAVSPALEAQRFDRFRTQAGDRRPSVFGPISPPA